MLSHVYDGFHRRGYSVKNLAKESHCRVPCCDGEASRLPCFHGEAFATSKPHQL
jgi:hypothetical protein